MSAPPELPEIVTRAFSVSRHAGYVSFCRNETGRLLATLAATRQGTMAEFGTGCGVGTAWLRSGAREGTLILTAERDEKLAGAASEIFTEDPQVEVLTADWSTLRDKGPSRCSSSTPQPLKTPTSTRWPISWSRAGSSYSMTSSLARCGHQSRLVGSTLCAKPG